jgi:hypothetical protein
MARRIVSRIVAHCDCCIFNERFKSIFENCEGKMGVLLAVYHHTIKCIDQLGAVPQSAILLLLAATNERAMI